MAIERVCASCFEDEDLRSWIREEGGSRGCDACETSDSPTCNLSDLCRYIESCLKKYWGFAVDQLPYDSAEGGYLGATWDTNEILGEEIGLQLPRDRRNHLYDAIVRGITDEVWCDYDWLTLDHDEALRLSWETFCETIKHSRRFFFHSEGTDDRDSYSSMSLLSTIAESIERFELICELPIGTKLWRARPDLAKGVRVGAENFGPPPKTSSLQSNRMNPPGIPMLYLASSAKTALKETRTTEARVGQWTAARPLRVLDLRKLPEIPGVFSGTHRTQRLELRFLHRFSDDVMMPVERDEQVHVDYLPSQVVTEYIRDFKFESGKLDGIVYGSTVHSGGWNVVLFANQIDLGLKVEEWRTSPAPWLRFVHSIRLKL